jgi:formyl-CoA transferase
MDGLRNRTTDLPLAGIRVIDFTANAAGPSCSMLLGDFGAEVIKIEPPSGDSTRQWGTARCGKNGDLTPTFISMNRNKASVVLDLKTSAGLAAAIDLLKSADVAIESFSPGVASRLGIGYEQVSAIKPEIIYCSVSGFGQTGPLSHRPGFDMLMQAFAGHMSITGEPGGRSVRSGPSSIDLVTGAHAAFGILLALRERDRSGRGQAIDASLFDNAVYLICNHITEAVRSGHAPEKFGADFPLLAPYGVFQASDREFYIGVSSDEMWRKFCEAIGRPELAADDRFRNNAGRLDNRNSLHEIIFPLFRERPAQYWVDLAIRVGIPTTLVNTMLEVAENDQTHARDLMIDSGVDGIRTVGTPVKLGRTPAQLLKAPPGLGEDTVRVLKELSSSKVKPDGVAAL